MTVGPALQDPVVRFWRLVDRGAGDDGCWLWLGSATRGYGVFSVQTGTPGSWRKVKTHRFAYETLIGPIPHGLPLDHLCRNPRCVNPRHLEPVTMRENSLRGVGACAVHARKTHCPAGHEYTPENTRVRRTRYGLGRSCRLCDLAASKAAFLRSIGGDHACILCDRSYATPKGLSIHLTKTHGAVA